MREALLRFRDLSSTDRPDIVRVADNPVAISSNRVAKLITRTETALIRTHCYLNKAPGHIMHMRSPEAERLALSKSCGFGRLDQ
jgi:hypothetical protein